MRYTISALSRKTGLSIHTLRFYEKEGILRHVERTPSGRRVYGEASVACLVGALCLKQARLTLAQIKEFFDQTLKGDESLPKRLEMLMTARRNIVDIREKLGKNLELLDFFIKGGKEALRALSRGENPDEAFPFLTRKGIISFLPSMAMADGKLEACVPSFLRDEGEEPKGGKGEKS